MTLDTDFHSHVSRSSASQMILAAKEKGLRVLGLSEHIFQMGEARTLLEHLPLEGPLLTLPTYFEAVRHAAQQFQFDARIGLEVDFIPDKNEQIQAYLHEQSWDFLIGSVHQIDGMQIEVKQKWEREQGEALWLRYFELLRAAVSSNYFSLVSHPVRLRVSNPFLPANFDQELEQLAAEATRCDVALELNGYDVLHSTSLVQRLAKACAIQLTPISVGSDAHDPRRIAQAHEQTEHILREAGITRIRIWKGLAAEEYNVAR